MKKYYILLHLFLIALPLFNTHTLIGRHKHSDKKIRSKTKKSLPSKAKKIAVKAKIHKRKAKVAGRNLPKKIGRGLYKVPAAWRLSDYPNDCKHLNKISKIPLRRCRIKGRLYTEHALERMAPPSKATIKDLTLRARKRGYKPGSKLFKDQIKPRGIAPKIVEEVIKKGRQQRGTSVGSFKYTYKNVSVITDSKGMVVTVY